jgi:IS5 family transposase
MRETVHQQAPLVPAIIDHSHAEELKRISELLDQLPRAAQLVHADLVHPKTKRLGRKGMPAEQVLRAMLIKQMNDFSYEELAFHLADSNVYRWFCRLGLGDKPPKKSTLQKSIKRVRAETWEAINSMVVQSAAQFGVERGDKARTDCTAVESDIHHPTDSTLLWDCVRVLVRLMNAGRDEFGIAFNDHSRRAKRRMVAILTAKRFERRIPLYRDLLKVTAKTVEQAKATAARLDKVEFADMMQMLKASGIAHQLRHYIELADRVIDQTRRRVLNDESVPAPEKIVSIFEPHTDIIVKDNRGPIYGHKVCLTAGASGIVTDVVVEHGNPADVTLATKMVERHCDLFGKPPRQMSFDGGFASRANLRAIKALGVKDVAFSKPCGMAITDMVKSTWVFRRLRRFRAGIESCISFLKRGFGLARCNWSGFPSFRAYVLGSVLACNLVILARHLNAAAT